MFQQQQQTPVRRVDQVSRVAFLIAHGLVPVEVIPGERVAFLFDDARGRATALLEAWKAGQTTVDAKAYSIALHNVRNAIAFNRTTKETA